MVTQCSHWGHACQPSSLSFLSCKMGGTASVSNAVRWTQRAQHQASKHAPTAARSHGASTSAHHTENLWLAGRRNRRPGHPPSPEHFHLGSYFCIFRAGGPEVGHAPGGALSHPAEGGPSPATLRGAPAALSHQSSANQRPPEASPGSGPRSTQPPRHLTSKMFTSKTSEFTRKVCQAGLRTVPNSQDE